MLRDSFAAFRKNPRSDELAELAEKHLQHDLRDSDRAVLKESAAKVSTHATLGSILGLGLGVFLAYRLRRGRANVFNALRAAEKPTHVQFADGRTGKTKGLFVKHLTSCSHLLSSSTQP